MTKSKRKLLISMLVAMFVIVSVVAVVTLVLAATQQNISTTLSINYETKDIDGSVLVQWKKGDNGTFTTLAPTGADSNHIGTNNELIFKATDTSAPGSFSFPEDMELDRENPYLLIKYTYTNTGSRLYVAQLIPNLTAQNNIKIEYSTDGTTYASTEYAVVLQGVEDESSTPISRSYYIKLSVENKSQNAKLEGSFYWDLTGHERSEFSSDDAYKTLASLQFTTNGDTGTYTAEIVNNPDSDNYITTLSYPSEVEGTAVTAIAASSLTTTQKDSITSVYIPDSVEEIKDSAFSGYSNLQSVTFTQSATASSVKAQSNSGLKTIGSQAFYKCGKLFNIQIPSTVTSIGEYAFSGCASLTELELPANLTNFNMNVYNHCTGLKTITIPACISVDIQDFDWSQLTSLTGINFQGGANKVLLKLTAKVADSSGNKQTKEVAVDVSSNATTNLTALNNAVSDGFDGVLTDVIYYVTSGVDILHKGSSLSSGKIVGSTLQLTSSVTPSDATKKTVTWSISSGSGATVSSSGLVTFTSSTGSVTVKATTKDTGRTDSVTITRVEPEMKLYNNSSRIYSNSEIVVPGTSTSADVKVELVADSDVLDPENVKVTDVAVTKDSEYNGYTTRNNNVITLTRGTLSNGYSWRGFTFTYRNQSTKIYIYYAYLQTLTPVIAKEDNSNCGLKGEKVYATKTYDASQSSTYYTTTVETLQFQMYPSNNPDGISVTVSGSVESWGYHSSSYDNGTFKVSLTPYPFDRSDPDRNVTVTIKAKGVGTFVYKYTFLAGGWANVSNDTGLSWAKAAGYAIVLQDNISTTHTSFPNMYGNGYTLDCSSSSNSTITFSKLSNIVILGGSSNSVAICGDCEYSRIKQMNKAWTGPESGHTITIKNTIFQDATHCGLQIGEETEGSVYLENTIFEDVGQSAVEFQNGRLYIKGVFDVYNFRAASEFESGSWGVNVGSAIEDAYASTAFADYVTTNTSGDKVANVAVLMPPDKLKPNSTKVYFYNESISDYALLSSSTDTTTGLAYKQISYSKTIAAVSYTICLVLPPINDTIGPNSTLTTAGESKIYGTNKLAYYNAHK